MLVDTSGFYCYLDADLQSHSDAMTLLNAADVRLTHSYVLAELVALCHARRFNRAVCLRFVASVIDSGDFEVEWVDERLHRAALSLLQSQSDKTYSLCDAVSFVPMRDRGLTEALTTDRHFEQAGFTRLLQP
jgi:predicted nucleic acid-binding protein